MNVSIAPLVLAFAPQAPAAAAPPAAEAPSAAQAPSARDTAAHIQQFGTALHRELAAEPGNHCFSALSVAAALAAAAEGARGDTARELTRALGLPEAAPAAAVSSLALALHPVARRRAKSDGAPVYALDFATSAWTDRNATIRPEFAAEVFVQGGCDWFPLDFSDAAASRNTIHEWVSKATRGKIREILPNGQPTSSTRLILLSTLYLKAAWQTPFSATQTERKAFHLGGDAVVTVPTMRRTGSMQYGETPKTQVVSLPFEDGALSCIIVLPKRDADLHAALDAESLADWTGRLAGRKVDLELPKFRIEYGAEVRVPLEHLGVKRAFDSKAADFSSISANGPLYISFVSHRTRLELNEDGCEAAAASAAGIAYGAKPKPEEPVEFHADRPFAYFIRHEATGAVLFAGHVANPAIEN